jgi:O-antigen ligase
VRPLAIGAGAIAGLALIVLVVTKFGQFAAVPHGSDAGGLDLSGNGRFQFWSSALDAFASNPLLGIGAGTFNGWWAAHGTLPVFIQNAHSLPLETLAELGIAGFATLSVFVITPIVVGIGRVRQDFHDPGLAVALAILAASLLSSSIDWMWKLPAAFVPAVIAIGLLAGPALAPPSSGRSRFGFGLLALLIGWVAILAAALSLFTDAKVEQAESAPDAASALRYARQAEALQPWAAEPVHQEMLALERAGDFPGALAAIDRAIWMAPFDYELWREKSRILQDAGDIPAAKLAGYGMIMLRPDLRLAGENAP